MRRDRPGEADATYREAVTTLMYTDEAQQQQRRDIGAQEEVLAGALTDLELLQRETGSRHEEAIGRIKEQVVGTIAAGGEKIARSRAKLDDFELSVYPATVNYAIHKEQRFRPPRDRLWVVWYRKEPRLGWSVLPELSHAAGTSKEDFGRDPKGGFRFQQVRYLERTMFPTCLRPGEFRLEAYLDGRLVANEVTDAEFRELEADSDPTFGIAVCRPDIWKRAVPKGLAGVASTWASPDGSRRAVVLKLDRDAYRPTVPVDEDAVDTLDWAVNRFERLFPGRARAHAVEWSGGFAGLESAIRRPYALTGGRSGRRHMLAGAGYYGEYVAWIGAVIGPRSFVDGAGYDIFTSLTVR